MSGRVWLEYLFYSDYAQRQGSILGPLSINVKEEQSKVCLKFTALSCSGASYIPRSAKDNTLALTIYLHLFTNDLFEPFFVCLEIVWRQPDLTGCLSLESLVTMVFLDGINSALEENANWLCPLVVIAVMCTHINSTAWMTWKIKYSKCIP